MGPSIEMDGPTDFSYENVKRKKLEQFSEIAIREEIW